MPALLSFLITMANTIATQVNTAILLTDGKPGTIARYDGESDLSWVHGMFALASNLDTSLVDALAEFDDAWSPRVSLVKSYVPASTYVAR